MNILVTGSNGFAGRHLTKHLKENGHQPLTPEIDLLNATETEVVISKQNLMLWFTWQLWLKSVQV